jgi:phosphomannomutase / phosphoglucomutase
MKRSLFLFYLLLNNCLLFATAQDHIFREYDIRGVVGKEFNVEDAYDMASAIATYLIEQDTSIKTISLGADGRVHSPAIKSQVRKALLDRGLNVIDIGTCTTPIMYYSLHVAPVGAGLMITASHNPGEYNGIKICKGTSSVSGPGIKRIREIYASQNFLPIAEESGTYEEINMIARYVDCLKKLFPHLIGADLHAIIDCGNGAAGTVLPLLIQEMGWSHVQLLYPEVDGTYPNHVADPTVEKYMQDLKEALVNSSDAEFGLGLDGDCDRMAPMTKGGRLVKGDQLLTIYSKNILEQNPGSAVVFDVSSSLVLHNVIRQWGGKPVISATGIAQVKKKMSETQALVGGEISCHTIFKDRFFGFDDGIYSMMRLFDLLQTSGRSLDNWMAELPEAFSSPLYRLACERPLCLKIIEALKEKFSERQDAELITVDGLRVHLPYGWAIVRASNTEPLISMRFEGNTQEDLSKLKAEFYEMMHPFFDCSAILKG